MMSKARNFGGREMMRQATLIETPSCELFQTLQNR